MKLFCKAALATLITFSTLGATLAEDIPEGEVKAGEAVPRIADMVPQRIKERGTLRIATMTKYRPFSYTVDGKTVGMIPEMAVAVSQTLGLKPEVTTMEFPGILLGLQGGQFDIGMAEYFVRSDRLEVADFLTEWTNYNGFLVNEGSAFKPQGLEDICGHKIAILEGSSGVPTMAAAKDVCEKTGKPGPDVAHFPNSSDAVLAVASNRVEAFMSGREIVASLLKAGQPFETYGRGMIDNPKIYRKGDQPPSCNLTEISTQAWLALGPQIKRTRDVVRVFNDYAPPARG